MKPTTIVSALAFVLGSASYASAKTSSVLEASDKNFKELIGSSVPVLVEFFAPWCGHCKKLAPEFESAASSLKDSKIQLASVDCTVEADICKKLEIRGYPTLAVFRNGEEVSKYTGPRDSANIVKFMQKQVAPAVTSVANVEALNKLKDQDELVLVAFYKDRKAPGAEEFTRVAEKLRNEYTFGIMAEAPAAYAGAEVVAFKKFDEGEVKFAEKVTFENLIAFIGREAIPTTAEIGPENYAKYVDSGRPLAYFFYADEKMREQFEPAVKAAAGAVKGKVNTVFINGASFGQHAEILNLKQEWPAFAIHEMEKDLKYPFPKEEKLTAESLTKFMESYTKGALKAHFKSQPIPAEDKAALKTLVHDNFEKVAFDKSKDVLVEIYAPWCAACKRIAPELEELAEKIAAQSSKMVLAKFDGVANDLPSIMNFRIEHYPTFKLIKSGTNEIVSFDGELSYNSLAEFLEKNAGADLKIERKAESSHEEEHHESGEDLSDQDGHDEL